MLKQGAGEQYNIPPKVLAIIANKADHNQDGYINFREFLHLVSKIIYLYFMNSLQSL